MFATGPDGQPPSFLNRARRHDRTTEEIVGFLRGIMADGVLNDQEIGSLFYLLEDRQADVDDWLFDTLIRRIDNAIADGEIDDEERSDLASAINQVIGGNGRNVIQRLSTEVPLSHPVPEIIFDRNAFVFTGKFAYGPRKKCQQEVEVRGGRCQSNVTLQTNYLIVGTLGSLDWRNTTHGNKIAAAVDYRERCDCCIEIVAEQDWLKYLMPA